MYDKRCTGAILVQKSADIPEQVEWIHHFEGNTHCPECLMLVGCFFTVSDHLPCPHHPFCHCTLEPVDYTVVLMNASIYSDYSKFDSENFYKHGKNKAFEAWGYTITDSNMLKAEIERQAREKYVLGDYKLGQLNIYGQRINIRIELPRKDGTGIVSFVTGWTIYPNGHLRLNTPYGGK